MVMRKKKGERIIRSPPNGISHSFVSYGRGKYRKGLKAITPPMTVEGLATGGVTTAGATGVQAIGYLAATYNTTEITANLNYGLNYLNASASTTSSPSYQTGQRSFKMGLDYAQYKSWFTNQEGQSLTLLIFDCVSKRDGPSSSYDPTTLWQTGLTSEVDGTGATNQTSAPGSMPTTSKTFNDYWKIAGLTKVELGPGRSHEHIFRHKLNRVFDTEILASIANYVKGISCASFVVAYGVPTDSSATSAVGTVSLSPVKLIWVTQFRHVSRALSSTPRGVFSTNTLSAAITPHFVQEDSGAIQSSEEVA